MNKGSRAIIVFMGFVVCGLILLIFKTYRLRQEKKLDRMENKVLEIISQGNHPIEEIQKILHKNRRYKELPLFVNHLLIFSVMMNDQELTKMLIDQKADVNFKYEPFFKEFALTRREQQIFMFVLDGKSNKEIENELYISYKTVKAHLYNIYKKLNVQNRLQLMNVVRDSLKNNNQIIKKF